MTTVRRSVALLLDRSLGPAAISTRFAAFARTTRDALIAEGKAPPLFETYVDGRHGAREEEVRPDGAILYRFNTVGLAAAFAIAYARERSPRISGEYRASWFLVVDGRPFAGDPAAIPAGATVMVTNHAPYHRKIDTGGQRGIGRGIVEATRQATRAKWPALLVDRAFVEIPAGYVLKGRRGRKGGRRLRSSARAGAVMTYPAVLIRARG